MRDPKRMSRKQWQALDSASAEVASINSILIGLREELRPGDVEPLSKWRPTHRHRKGGLYRVLHGAGAAGDATIEATMTPVVIYESEDGRVWVRPFAEFHDGRFTPVTAGD